jgi:eukaryotic-like serine/threonine-protein kinase
MQVLPKIPGYELVQHLGGGPLTCVYSGREWATDYPCAVKVLRPGWQDHSTAIKLLQREARAGLAVRHPHLVAFRHVHVTRPPYFVVMDLLPGESLRRRLRRDYRLDVPTTLWIVRQVGEALAALHRAGFIHADVKPDNIRLIDAGTAVLIDLGFAHRPGENARLRRHGYVLGTVNYLAPELCDFSSEADFRSDLFSLGVTLFEMLTGKLPYPRGTTEQTYQRDLHDSPLDIRNHTASLPAALASLVERLLNRKPEDRPRATAMVQQLIALEIAAMRRRKSA